MKCWQGLLIQWTILSSIGLDCAATTTTTTTPPPTTTPSLPSGTIRPWGIPAGGSSEVPSDNSEESISSTTTTKTTTTFSGGAQSNDYVGVLEAVKSNVLQNANEKIEALRRQVEEEGKVIGGFGSKCDTISVQALEEFAANAPDMGDDAAAASAYDRKLEEVEAAVDAPLQVLYMRQLALLREEALQKFRTTAKSSGSSEYEAMLQADAQFTREAEEITREGSDWDYTTERTFLQTVMSNIAESGKKALDVQMKSAQTQQTAMQFLQSQQQMIQQLQMQLYGQSSPWNIGMAYRIPDTNFNLQGSYQQGRANVQFSCVPDEYAPFLGPNGFTNGVGPGNLGLSLNLSI